MAKKNSLDGAFDSGVDKQAAYGDMEGKNTRSNKWW